jgi:hypothetical protein
MPKLWTAGLTPLALAFIVGAAPLSARADCPAVGLISRIDGRPQDVIITRIEDGRPIVVSRPRILEPVCQGDTIHAVGTTSISISVDGSGPVRVNSNLDYRVPARSGPPSPAGNAYRLLMDQVMPDMKRLPWNVMIKGAGDDFGFALPALSAGGQQLQAGRRTLLVRLVGGTPPYDVELRTALGALAASQSSTGHQVILPSVVLSAGGYQVKVIDAAQNALTAQLTVVDAGPTRDPAFDAIPDPENRASVAAIALARASPGVWSFEAEQLVEAAPATGLDRDKVYELIESYPAN